jgi:competence protein ComEC
MRVHVIDVDQGNSTLVEFPCAAVLIDAGGRTAQSDAHLIAWLDAFFARRTDLGRRLAVLFVTHPHADHNRALRLVAEHYDVGGYVDDGLTTGSGRYAARWMAAHIGDAAHPIPHLTVSNALFAGGAGKGYSDTVVDPVACPGVDPQIRVLAGARGQGRWTSAAYANLNNHSVVIRIDYGSASMLFPGDAQAEEIADLLSRYAGTDLLDVDVLMVNHHGAQNGVSQRYLAALSPEIAVLSLGASAVHAQWTAYQYGHPRLAAVRLLEANVSGSREPAASFPVATGQYHFTPMLIDRAIYATGWDGDIDLTAGVDGTWTVSHH